MARKAEREGERANIFVITENCALVLRPYTFDHFKSNTKNSARLIGVRARRNDHTDRFKCGGDVNKRRGGTY